MEKELREEWEAMPHPKISWETFRNKVSSRGSSKTTPEAMEGYTRQEFNGRAKRLLGEF